MFLDVALNPAEIGLLPQRDLTSTTCVVFDVLRATSSMITALHNGATAIHPVRTIEEALALKERMPAAVLGGERRGELIPGFDVGNAPQEYTTLAGRAIISTTTNGTVALCACAGARRVLVGALLNLDALARELRREDPENVLLVCAGTFTHFALEDAYAAGALISELVATAPVQRSDAARAASAVARQFSDPLHALGVSRNGVALAEKGRSAEVEWCAQRSVFKVVGQMQSAVIRPVAP